MLQASLKVIGGKNDGKLIEFQTKKFLVGREQDCHLRPNSDLVSRHHCVFSLDDYALRLRDLGSTNGTLVNGRRIRGETLLTTGDVVRIGKLNLEVVIGNELPMDSGSIPSEAVQETTTNASAMDTSHEVPQPTTLEDSGNYPASSSSETIQFEVANPQAEDMGSSDQNFVESDTTVANASNEETIVDPSQPLHPVSADAAPPQQPEGYPQQFPQQYPQQAPWQYPQYPQGGWQYPQYPPPGYPMGYAPPGYPNYGYPGQQFPGQYPQQGQGVPHPEQQQPAQDDPGSSAEIPSVRLPNPEETGVKDEPKPTASGEAPPPKTDESTPSKSAADLINASRRRRRAEE